MSDKSSEKIINTEVERSFKTERSLIEDAPINIRTEDTVYIHQVYIEIDKGAKKERRV